MVYTYFVSYAYFQKGAAFFKTHGFGSAPFELSHPVARFDDVLLLADLIKQAMIRQGSPGDIEIAIINWKQFEPDIERLEQPTSIPQNVLSLTRK